VTRYEYAVLCMQMGALEAQANRNRIDLDIQLHRIAQLQDELEILKRARWPLAVPLDSLMIPVAKTAV